ncbi:hypothetical protein [Avibacterium paragallinarum]|uniref:DUF4282 domain-containing protein n=1 Tax=Avibacterium paragallinarum TaxID=728 RepID=A0ABU7QLP9_AVIPA|nr:hypothetical protein [Avibacterium paragallinarum]QZP14667.1 hypothetical protein K5O18_07365 [Avibacterium paragallinarum]QZP14748.1 hypothetical protein K5O18_07840 [Avibacterium paragallinarum]WAL56701.1 hypothetical protein OY678_12410 [Avibacterium paragallinarum]
MLDYLIKLAQLWRNFVNQLFARFSNVEGMNARSNVIVSLLWLFFLTLGSTITYGIWGEKEFVMYFLLVILGIEIAAIIGAFWYFAINNPDYLRSETYTLSKLAIEKGQLGDTNNGLISVVQARIIDSESVVKDGDDV